MLLTLHLFLYVFMEVSTICVVLEKIFIFDYIRFTVSALVDLNGRFFGGREVCASFYNVQDFQNNSLTK